MLKIISVIIGSMLFSSPQTDEVMAASGKFFGNSLAVVDKPFITGEYRYSVKKGDSLSGILERHKIHKLDATRIANAIGAKANLTKLKTGSEFDVIINYDKNFNSTLSSIAFEVDRKEVTIIKSLTGKYITKIAPITTTAKLIRKKGNVKTTIDELGREMGVPANIMLEYVRALQYKINFSRDVRRGTEIELLYEQHYNKKGKKVKDGNLLFASIDTGRYSQDIYRFSSTGRSRDAKFYTPDGKLAGKAKSTFGHPIKGRRKITSRFGMRTHPIHKKRRMHKGVDYGAKRGTPILAPADGVVLRAGRAGSYGNYIRVKHNSTYQSAFAHMQRFAKNVSKGSRVRKGQVIGYVGSTGASTGPHLHYEVIKNGRHINPLSVRVVERQKLSRSALSAFKREKSKIDNLIKQAVAIAN